LAVVLDIFGMWNKFLHCTTGCSKQRGFNKSLKNIYTGYYTAALCII
jgi:hypothetical protein